MRQSNTTRAATERKPEAPQYSQGTPRQAPPKSRKETRPFAAVVYELLPRLTDAQLKVWAALHHWARRHNWCSMSDASVGALVGKHPGTVQRIMRQLEALGYVRREGVPKTAENGTGRVVHLNARWRSDVAAQPCPEVAAPALDKSPSAEKRSEGEAAGVGLATQGPPPPPARPDPEPQPEAPTEAEVEQWRGWCASRDRHLARIGRAGLEAAGLLPPAEPPTPAAQPPAPTATVPAPVAPTRAPKASPAPEAAPTLTPKAAPSPTAPTNPARGLPRPSPSPRPFGAPLPWPFPWPLPGLPSGGSQSPPGPGARPSP